MMMGRPHLSFPERMDFSLVDLRPLLSVKQPLNGIKNCDCSYVGKFGFCRCWPRAPCPRG